MAPDPAIPSSPLPLSKLRGLLGPGLTDRVEQQAGPGISPVMASGNGFTLLHVLAWQPATAPPLEQIRERVSAEWQRRQSEQHLRQLLRELRERYPVQTAPLA